VEGSDESGDGREVTRGLEGALAGALMFLVKVETLDLTRMPLVAGLVAASGERCL
jgi:hypothetical protein